MKTVIIESPYGGDVERAIAAIPNADPEFNVEYARAAMIDCLRRGEAPFASHLLYTQVLDDADEAQRTLGILAGLQIAKRFDKTVVYTDLGISRGMKVGIQDARKNLRPVEYRSLPEFARLRYPGVDCPPTKADM